MKNLVEWVKVLGVMVYVGLLYLFFVFIGLLVSLFSKEAEE